MVVGQGWHFTRVKLVFPAQRVKPGLNQIKPGLSGQNWVQHYRAVHYVSSTFLPSGPVCSKQYSVCLIFHSIMYP